MAIAGHDMLVDHFYRTNYAVFLKSTIDRLSPSDLELWEKLQSEYNAKWPIASKIEYRVEVSDGDRSDPDKDFEKVASSEFVIHPCSLMYSMPDDWQRQMANNCTTLGGIFEDDAIYRIESGQFFEDPFQHRHSRWSSDKFLDPSQELKPSDCQI